MVSIKSVYREATGYKITESILLSLLLIYPYKTISRKNTALIYIISINHTFYAINIAMYLSILLPGRTL